MKVKSGYNIAIARTKKYGLEDKRHRKLQAILRKLTSERVKNGIKHCAVRRQATRKNQNEPKMKARKKEILC